MLRTLFKKSTILSANIFETALKSLRSCKTKKLKIMNIEIIGDQIRNEIVEGSKMIASNPLQMEIYDILQRNEREKLLQVLKQTPEKLMTELAKCLIYIWPASPTWAFQLIEDRLKPLKNIAGILNPKELNEWVHIWHNPCVIEDSRISLEHFKKNLWQQVFLAEQMENK
jgi:hypothetical protein